MISIAAQYMSFIVFFRSFVVFLFVTLYNIDFLCIYLQLPDVMLCQVLYCMLLITIVSGQLPTRTIPHPTGIGPDGWFYWLVVVLVGSCSSGE